MEKLQLQFDPDLAPLAPVTQPHKMGWLGPLEVSRYQDVITLLRHPDVETRNPSKVAQKILTSMGRDPAPVLQLIRLTALVLGGEEHQGVRDMARRLIGAISQSWTADRIEKISQHILSEATYHELCDAHHDIALRLTDCFIAEEFDLPATDLLQIREQSHFMIEQLAISEFKLADVLQIADQAHIYVQQTALLLEQAKLLPELAELPRQDAGILFGLNTAPITLMLSQLISFSIVTLSQQPKLVDTLRQAPQYLAGFINECLRLANVQRWSTPTITKAEIILSDCSLAANTVFRCNFERANRDPSVFSKPHLIDLRRNQPSHISFGAGPHVCLGASFSWRVMQAFLTQLISDFEITAVSPPVEINTKRGRKYSQAQVQIRRKNSINNPS